MKIGIFSSGEGTGGTEKIAIYLAEFLKKKHDVDILLWKKWENSCFHTSVPQRCLFSKRIPPYDNILLTPLIYSMKNDYDAYFNMTFFSSLFVSKLIAFRKPIVHYFHNPPLDLNGFLGHIAFSPFLFIEKFHKIMKNIPTVCNSNYTKEEILKFYGIEPRVIHSPVDLDKFSPAKKSSSDFILLTGRITAFKKYEKALQFLKEEKIRVIIAGRAGEINYYNFLKKQFPFVEFRINVSEEELVKLYQNCKLYIFTNPEEHYGLVVPEAMACGKTVLVPKGCGASELITDGENGYLFEPDYSNFKEKLYEALHNDIGKKARKYVEENLSPDAYGEKMLNMLYDNYDI